MRRLGRTAAAAVVWGADDVMWPTGQRAPNQVWADKAYSLRSKCLERVALDARDDGVWLKAYCCCCGSGGMAAPLSGTPRLLIEI
jgi:hypothetical protein